MQYKVRYSSRSKWAKLIMSLQEGLVVVLPYGFIDKKIPDLLQKKNQWILKQEKRLNRIRQFAGEAKSRDLPTEVEFPVLSQKWRVVYSNQKKKSVKFEEDCSSLILTLYGNVENQRICRELLKKWIFSKAKDYLIDRLCLLAAQKRFQVNEVKVRTQSRIWGSCSKKKNISLNSKLIFFPQEVLDYVLLHELCHTVHLNHSSKYWTLLETYLPNYKSLDKEAKWGSKFVPGWWIK